MLALFEDFLLIFFFWNRIKEVTVKALDLSVQNNFFIYGEVVPELVNVLEDFQGDVRVLLDIQTKPKGENIIKIDVVVNIAQNIKIVQVIKVCRALKEVANVENVSVESFRKDFEKILTGKRQITTRVPGIRNKKGR